MENAKTRKILEILLFIFILSLPFQTRLIISPGVINDGFWEYGTFSVYATEILLWVILIAYFYLLTRTKNKFGKPVFNVRTAVYFGLVVLIASGLISAAFALSKSVALLTLFRLIEALALMIFLATSKINLEKIFWAISASGFIQASLAITQFFSQKVIANKWLGIAGHYPWELSGESVVENSAGRFLRSYGAMPHPNILGGFLVVAALASIWLFLKGRQKNASLLSLCFLAANLLGLALSFSRSAAVAFIVSSVIFLTWDFLSKKNLPKSAMASLFLIALALFLSIIYNSLYQTRLQNQSRLEQVSQSQRFLLMQEALTLAPKHIFRGLGIGNYTLAVYQNINNLKASYDYQPVHLMYLLILAEIGIIGFAAFATIIFGIVIILIKNQSFIGLSLAATIIIIGFFDHYFWSLYFGIVFFWLTFGIALNSAVPLTAKKSQ